jgi:hypothetical protein
MRSDTKPVTTLKQISLQQMHVNAQKAKAAEHGVLAPVLDRRHGFGTPATNQSKSSVRSGSGRN